MRRSLRFVVPLVVLALLPALSTSPAHADAVMVAPKLEKPVEATYPEAAQAEQRSGTVLLQLDIDASGAVIEATVLEPAGHGFDEAAVEAAKKLVFTPATKDGAKVPARIKYRYAFTWKDKTQVVPPPPIGTTTAVAATTGELSGSIRVAGPDVPLAGARVTVTAANGAPVGSFTTIEDGGFDLRELPAGIYKVTISATGFAPVVADEAVFAGKRTETTYRLAPPSAAGEILIVGDRPPREVTVRTLEQREMARIPGTNGDALKSLQALPGVGRSPGLGAQLIIRGAAPQDTQVFVEGVPIPIVYHFGGISSVIPTEMLERLDFRPGNFGVEYGRVMGGIVDVKTIAAPTDGKFHGLAQADFIDTRFVAKGPIPLLHDWAFVVGGRRSYVDLWLKPLLASRGAGFTAAPIYYDWQAFAENHPTTNSRLRFGFYGSNDRLEIFRDTINTRDPAESGDLAIHTGFGRFVGSYENQISKTVHFRQVLAYGYDVTSFTNGARSVEIVAHPFTDRSELSLTLGKGYVLHLGADVLYTTTRVDLTQPRPRVAGEPADGNTQILFTENDAPTFFSPAVYSEMEMQLTKRLRLVPGFRIDYTGATQRFNTSPRISARYVLLPGENPTTLKGGVGAFYQPPQPLQISPVFGTPGLYSNRAIHTSLGVEQTLGKRVEISFEGFYKHLDELVARTPSASGGFNYSNLGTGYVVGTELLIRYKPDARFFGWIAYTLSRSTRRDNPAAAQHLFQYDQTHILTVLGSYRLGGGWEIGARFRLVSGNLFTPCLGGALDASTNAYTCVSGSPFSERLPAFHQIDIRLDKHWYFRDWQISTYLDLYNAYNHGSPEGIAYNFDYSQKIYQTGLPIIPSFGVRGEL